MKGAATNPTQTLILSSAKIY